MTHISNVSFQYGFNVFFITAVVFVCSPLRVATAKGSGKPINHMSQLPTTKVGVVGRTEHFALV